MKKVKIRASIAWIVSLSILLFGCGGSGGQSGSANPQNGSANSEYIYDFSGLIDELKKAESDIRSQDNPGYSVSEKRGEFSVNADQNINYFGEIKDGKPNGWGIYGNQEMLYLGRFNSGKVEGEGIRISTSGKSLIDNLPLISIQVGKFDGSMNKGEFNIYTPRREGIDDNEVDIDFAFFFDQVILDNLTYSGECNEDGYYDGFGSTYFWDREINSDYKFPHYVGEFKNGDYHGQGKLFSFGTATYDEGLYDKDGTFSYENGIYDNGILEYEGKFASGKFYGKGTLYRWEENRKYGGEFKIGEFQGDKVENITQTDIDYANKIKENVGVFVPEEQRWLGIDIDYEAFTSKEIGSDPRYDITITDVNRVRSNAMDIDYNANEISSDINENDFMSINEDEMLTDDPTYADASNYVSHYTKIDGFNIETSETKLLIDGAIRVLAEWNNKAIDPYPEVLFDNEEVSYTWSQEWAKPYQNNIEMNVYDDSILPKSDASDIIYLREFHIETQVNGDREIPVVLKNGKGETVYDETLSVHFNPLPPVIKEATFIPFTGYIKITVEDIYDMYSSEDIQVFVNVNDNDKDEEVQAEDSRGHFDFYASSAQITDTYIVRAKNKFDVWAEVTVDMEEAFENPLVLRASFGNFSHEISGWVNASSFSKIQFFVNDVEVHSFNHGTERFEFEYEVPSTEKGTVYVIKAKDEYGRWTNEVVITM
jgi:hypothetical protein